ncbi:GFA family protein (plasmid) [Paracoccus sp. TK19116]|uniref:GFA family protein n=1 Tax=Paracoccus albicereus TaxID=2922394 RepID=A0ABT1MMF0_9RHOB|nr:GFA family protein [Paracoccus albicereus]MCQ0969465.1 GFA family protein [Paracoccus albicereus]
MSKRDVTGRCLCGAVSLRARTDARIAHECHCSQCRRQSGHVWAYVTLPRADVVFDGPVSRHAHTDAAERGFCPTCGSFLFWAKNGEDAIDVSAGSLDAPTGLTLGAPSQWDSRGDYY